MWKRILCWVLGHKWEYEIGCPTGHGKKHSFIGRDCRRCHKEENSSPDYNYKHRTKGYIVYHHQYPFKKKKVKR